MTQYRIICLQGAAFSSWDEPRTLKEIRDTFMDYAEMDDWDEIPARKEFTLAFIANVWEVDFEKRLVTYWKRYSNKVHARGYWANR